MLCGLGFSAWAFSSGLEKEADPGVDDCGTVQSEPPPLSLWQAGAPRTGGPWLPDSVPGAGAASPALLGAGVLHHGHVPELEGVDRHEYQRHVGPSSSQNASSSFHHRCVVDPEEREAEPCCDRAFL